MKFVSTTKAQQQLYEAEELKAKNCINNLHTYNFKTLTNKSCWSAAVAPIAVRNFFKVERQQLKSVHYEIYKNWKNQNFCIAAS